MINDIVVKIVIINRWLLLTRAWITISLGMNPRNGGSPPNDRKFIMIVNFRGLDLNVYENSWFIWAIPIVFMSITMFAVNTVYTKKYKDHRDSLDIMAANIHLI